VVDNMIALPVGTERVEQLRHSAALAFVGRQMVDGPFLAAL
jgi:hypothetical protein